MSEYITIKLTQGQETVISSEDSDLADLRWYAIRDNNTFYAGRNTPRDEYGKQKRILIHRVILERILGRPLEKGEFPDHKDLNGLNNTRDNLRLSDRYTNQYNRINISPSGVKGVRWNKQEKKWMAGIKVNGKQIHLGYFVNIDDAAKARYDATIKYHGEFGRF